MPWTRLAEHAEILAVHAAYVGFGKILYFGGDQHSGKQNEAHAFDATRLFDCGSFSVKTLPSPPFDSFCSGHTFLGAVNVVQILVAGGTERFSKQVGFHHDHFPGLRDAAIFSSPDCATGSGGWNWQSVAGMNLTSILHEGPSASWRTLSACSGRRLLRVGGLATRLSRRVGAGSTVPGVVGARRNRSLSLVSRGSAGLAVVRTRW